LRFAARRCSGVHMGRSYANQAPNKESQPTPSIQELPGSALSLFHQQGFFPGAFGAGLRREPKMPARKGKDLLLKMDDCFVTVAGLRSPMAFKRQRAIAEEIKKKRLRTWS
jgi:hypothetical protein